MPRNRYRMNTLSGSSPRANAQAVGTRGACPRLSRGCTPVLQPEQVSMHSKSAVYLQNDPPLCGDISEISNRGLLSFFLFLSVFY